MRRARTRVTARAASQDGIAMVVAVMVLILGTALVVVMASASIRASHDVADRASRVGGLPHIDTAVQKYQLALNAGLANEANGYLLDSTTLNMLTVPGLSTVVANGGGTAYANTFASPAPGPAPPAFAMREKLTKVADPDTVFGYWQVIRVDPPQYGPADYANLTVYFRAWVQDANDATVATRQRIVRAEFRPGYFSDYQLLTNTGIKLIPGSEINGHVHTNGYLDGLNDPPGGGAQRIWVDTSLGAGSVTCTNSPFVTAARGQIDSGALGGCQPKENTGRVYSLLRAETAFKRMATCPAGVACP